ncbi:MAG TPA: ABC transporter substrate-binding protein, partial [Terriglobales bacterium]|nr:ABC transporter substrate-binding protein [Terriglobales bacterium]
TSRRQLLAGLAGLAGAVLLHRPSYGEAGAIERIVSVGGAITEIVFALGFGNKVVAVDTTSCYPLQATAALPKVGYLRSLAAEGLLSMKPDLILLDADAGPADVLDQLKRLAAPVAHFIERPSAQSVADKIIFVGAALKQADKAAEIAATFRQDLATVAASVKLLLQRPRVLFLMNAGTTGLRGAGGGTAAAEMIALAGGRNAFGDSSGYKTISAEAALIANPGAIVMMSQTLDELGGRDGVAKLPVLAKTKAAQEGRIFGFDGNYLLGFGPRTAHAVAAFATVLHPQGDIVALPPRPWTMT